MLEKPTFDFYKVGGVKVGLRSYCIPCEKIRIMEWTIKNKDKIFHRRKIREAALTEEKREAKRAYSRNWFASRKEIHSQKMKEWYAANKERVKANHQAWYKANKKIHLKKTAAYAKSLREKDPHYRTVCLLRSRMGAAFRCRGIKKNIKSLDLVGCSKEELMNHIQSLFKPGMNWNNRNLWHVDHIRPVKSFNLIDIEEQKKCFHYTNLQPLWSYENFQKSSKFEAASFGKASNAKT